MHWTRICIVAGLLTFSAQATEAAAPARTMDLEILANGQLLLRGELIDGIDDLEAKLRIMRSNQPPFELSIKLPKTFSFASIASAMKVIERMGLNLGLTGNGERAKPAPQPHDSI
jgi:hypothetical protein